MTQKSVAERSFEEAMQRLEEIVAKLEGGSIGLEESLQLFEEGVALARHCQDRLQYAQGRLESLVQKENGQVSIVPFQLEEET
jgi:exodeoxyribonuclease VII small subunit